MSIDLKTAKAAMEKSLEHLRGLFSKMRVGRASTAMVEDIKVPAYGSQMSVKELAALSIPDARTIAIQPWDKGVMADIERAILAANIGLTPINDGKLVRINLPSLTEERRKEFVKEIKKEGEDSKVSIRNVRRDFMELIKKSKEKGTISEDEQRRTQDELQKITDSLITEVDKAVDSKSKEVMSI